MHEQGFVVGAEIVTNRAVLGEGALEAEVVAMSGVVEDHRGTAETSSVQQCPCPLQQALVSRSWASMRRRWSMRAAASSQRAAATASGGMIDSTIRAARAAMIFCATPLGTSSHSTACSLQTTWVRALPTSTASAQA
jgi:hypothetical protein